MELETTFESGGEGMRRLWAMMLEGGNHFWVFHQCVSHGAWWATPTAHRSCGSCASYACRDTFAGNPRHQKLATGASSAAPASLTPKIKCQAILTLNDQLNATYLCGMCLRQLHTISPPMEKPMT